MAFKLPATTVSGTPPSARESHVSWHYDGKLYVFGGFDGERVLNDMYAFECDNKHWIYLEKEISGKIPTPRAGHACVVIGKSIYVHGGANSINRFEDMYKLNMDTMSWTLVEDSGNQTPVARYYHSLAMMPDTPALFVAFGGNSGKQILNDTAVFDTTISKWSNTSCTGSAPPPLYGHKAAFTTSAAMVLFGGMTEKNKPTSELHVLDVKAWNWTTPHIRKGKVPAMAFPSGAAVGGSIYCFGGSGEKDLTLDSFLKIDLDALECMTVKVPTPYRGRHRHTMTNINGLDMVIFGGFDGLKVTDDTYVVRGAQVMEAPLSAAKPKSTGIAATLGFDVMTDVARPDTATADGGGGDGDGAKTSRSGSALGATFRAFGGAVGLTGGETQVMGKNTQAAISASADRAKAEMMEEMAGMRNKYEAELTMARGDIAKLVVTMEIMKREFVEMKDELETLKHDSAKLKAHARKQSVVG